MKYFVEDKKIIIPKVDEFNPRQILECGQMFRFEIHDEVSEVISRDKRAVILDRGEFYEVGTDDPAYFVSFLDLSRDYITIKKLLKKDNVLAKVIPFGEGVRIAKGDALEIIFSFVISANNNIPRIKKIISKLCEYGEDMGGFRAFPKIEVLSKLPLEVYSSLGAGYRDKYLFKLSRELAGVDLKEKAELSTPKLRNWLISLPGIGPKVADCVLLFGFNRFDVFPVDTWVEKVYSKWYNAGEKTRPEISKFFVSKFGDLAGFAQQYLFYGARSFDLLD